MNLAEREAFAQLLDDTASSVMPSDGDTDGHPLDDATAMRRVQLAMQLNQYAFRVRNGDVDPDLITQVILGFRRVALL